MSLVKCIGIFVLIVSIGSIYGCQKSTKQQPIEDSGIVLVYINPETGKQEQRRFQSQDEADSFLKSLN